MSRVTGPFAVSISIVEDSGSLSDPLVRVEGHVGGTMFSLPPEEAMHVLNADQRFLVRRMLDRLFTATQDQGG